MTTLVFLGGLAGSIMLGFPVFIALLLAALAMMLWMGNVNAMILAQKFVDGADSFPLMAIPFFLLAGELMNAGGLSKRIVALAMALFGHMNGGLGFVVIGTGLLLASLSGSAIADTATLAVMLLPLMREGGYDLERSTGLMAATGIIAPIIPPSIGFIVLGVTANLSISGLFLAGIVPGIMMALSLMVVWTLLSRSNPTVTQPRKSTREVLVSLRGSIWALFMPVIIIGGLKFGVFTPTEAGIIAATYAFLISMFVYREISIRDVHQSFLRAAKMTSVIMILVAASMVSAWLMTIANIPGQVVQLVEPLVDHPKLLMLAICFSILVIGTVLDFTPAILILVPVLLPVVNAADIDPIYFGVLFLMTAAIGMITPPVGAVLNVVCGVARIPIERSAVGVLPFLLTEVGVLLLLILFPALVTVPGNWFAH
ncbi:TRAP transporter large permease [Halovulum sp. GXIMD14794]